MKNTQELSDRDAIKEVVDRFSILADKKDVKTQVSLFTENATSETFINGASVSKLNGRKELENAFDGFLKSFEIVYHFNGQQVVNIAGDKASGTSYCLVTLIGTENGQKMKTTTGVVYEDEFVRETNHWLIAKRKAMFDWQEKSHWCSSLCRSAKHYAHYLAQSFSLYFQYRIYPFQSWLLRK